MWRLCLVVHSFECTPKRRQTLRPRVCLILHDVLVKFVCQSQMRCVCRFVAVPLKCIFVYIFVGCFSFFFCSWLYLFVHGCICLFMVIWSTCHFASSPLFPFKQPPRRLRLFEAISGSPRTLQQLFALLDPIEDTSQSGQLMGSHD